MPRSSSIQSSFAAGEVSTLLQGATNLPRYKEGLAICQNYIPLLQGPKTRRPGTGFIFPVKDSSKVTRLIRFSVSNTQNFMLEFGDSYVRVFKNYAPVTLPGFNISNVTQANPAVFTAVGHTYAGGEHVLIDEVLGMTELNNREFVVQSASGDTFTVTDNLTGVSVDSSGYTPYASGGTVAEIYEITSIPYRTADLPLIHVTQSNDVLYLAHPSYPPNELIRMADDDWSPSIFNYQDGPYLDEDIQNGTTMTLSFVAANWHLTASGILDINGGRGFQASDAGRHVRLLDGAQWNWARISSVVSTTEVILFLPGSNEVNPTNNFTPGDVISDWRLGVWSFTDGFPTSTVFYQDRLVFVGAGADPTRFDGSASGDYPNFAPTAQDGTIAADNAYSFVLSSNDLNSLAWATSDEQGLVMGTYGSEWVVGAADSNSALSATSVSAKKTTSIGSNSVQAVQLGKCTLFVQSGGRKLRELQYNFYTTGFNANDLTVLSEHITSGGITYLASQKTPQPIMWAVRGDGVLLAMTYERDLESVKVGWSRHVLGGTVSGGGDAIVESVAVLPSSNGETEDVWVIVQREVNGNTVRYIEYITPMFQHGTALEDAFFLDSGLTYSGSSTSTISGLYHLNGQTVSILADGNKQTNKVPVNGRITLDTPASVVTVGLPYNSDGQKLRTDAGAADGTSMGKTRRTHRIGFNLLDTAGLKVGPDFDTLDDISLDNTTAGVIGAAGLFTGICTLPISTQYDFDNMICWRQSDPFPGTILGLYPQMETQDR